MRYYFSFSPTNCPKPPDSFLTLISHDNLSVSFFWSTHRFITNHGSPIYLLLCSATASPAAPMWRVTRWRSWTSCPTTWWSTWSSHPSLPVCWCRRRMRRPSSSSPRWGYVGWGAVEKKKTKCHLRSSWSRLRGNTLRSRLTHWICCRLIFRDWVIQFGESAFVFFADLVSYKELRINLWLSALVQITVSRNYPPQDLKFP